MIHLLIVAVCIYVAHRIIALDRIPHAPVRMVCGRCNGKQLSTAVWHLHCQAHDMEETL